jgi:hypothetical protein
MRLTIIPSDNYVAVNTDNSHQPLDLSSCGIPSDVHALQWYDTRGWVEFSDDNDPFTPKPANQDITELPEWATNCVQVWQNWTPPTPPEEEQIPVTVAGQ